MADQGYPFEGADRRLVPHLGWLQRLFIISAPPAFTRKRFRGWELVLQPMPLFLMAEKKKGSRWRQIRIGWTWRKHEQHFIPGAAWKWEDKQLPDYQA